MLGESLSDNHQPILVPNSNNQWSHPHEQGSSIKKYLLFAMFKCNK